MSNDFYNASGSPGTGSAGSSSVIRSEYVAIQSAFDKLAPLSGNAGKAVIVNAGATGYDVTAGALALAGNLTTTGAYNTTLAQQASVTLTLPGANGTLATLAGSEALTNKTVNGLTISTTTGTFALTSGKTFSVSATLTLAGVDGKTLTIDKSLEFDGTDSTKMTFPGTNASIARTDAGQTFTGVQTFSTPIARSSIANETHEIQIPLTGFSITLSKARTILTPAGTLATGTITMPATPGDGAVYRITSTQQVTALTLQGNSGDSVVGGATFLAAEVPIALVYDLANTTWYPTT